MGRNSGGGGRTGSAAYTQRGFGGRTQLTQAGRDRLRDLRADRTVLVGESNRASRELRKPKLTERRRERMRAIVNETQERLTRINRDISELQQYERGGFG